MRDLATLFIHLIGTLVRSLGPGGLRSVVAQSLLCAGLMHRTRLLRSAIVLKPSTIMDFHRALVQRKYRLLFMPKRRGRPGPTGPSPELIAAIVEIKRRNPRFGYQRIAQQLSGTFGLAVDKDVVRRVLAKHYRPGPAAVARPGSRSSGRRKTVSGPSISSAVSR